MYLYNNNCKELDEFNTLLKNFWNVIKLEFVDFNFHCYVK